MARAPSGPCPRCDSPQAEGHLACPDCGEPLGTFRSLQQMLAVLVVAGFAAYWWVMTPLTGGDPPEATADVQASQLLVALLVAVLLASVVCIVAFGRRMLAAVKVGLRRRSKAPVRRILLAQFLVVWAGVFFVEALGGAPLLPVRQFVVDGVSYDFGSKGVVLGSTAVREGEVALERGAGPEGPAPWRRTGEGAIQRITVAGLGKRRATLSWGMTGGELAVVGDGDGGAEFLVDGVPVLSSATVRRDGVIEIGDLRVVVQGPVASDFVAAGAVGKLASLILLLLGCAAFGGRPLLTELGLLGAEDKGWQREVGRGTVALLAFLPVYSCLVLLTKLVGQALGIPVASHPLVQALQQDGALTLVALVVFQAVVLAPVIEETLFRGFLLGACAPVLGRAGALVVSALAFSLIHQGFASLAPMFGLGLLFGAIRLSGEGSLLGSIVAHALFNGLTLTLLFASAL